MLPLQRQRDAWISRRLVLHQQNHHRNNPAGLLPPSQQVLWGINKEQKQKQHHVEFKCLYLFLKYTPNRMGSVLKLQMMHASFASTQVPIVPTLWLKKKEKPISLLTDNLEILNLVQLAKALKKYCYKNYRLQFFTLPLFCMDPHLPATFSSTIPYCSLFLFLFNYRQYGLCHMSPLHLFLTTPEQFYHRLHSQKRLVASPYVFILPRQAFPVTHSESNSSPV